MTDRPKRLKPPAASVTMAAAAGTFLAAFGFLADQVRTGHDPAIGPARETTAAVRPVEKRRAVIRRRVVITRVVHDAPAAPALVPTAPAPAPTSPAPVVRTSAPAPAPAPVAPAPAPAPPPAPVVTRAS